MTDELGLFVRLLGGNRGWLAIDLAEWEGGRVTLWHPVHEFGRLERLALAHGWTSDPAFNLRPYADRGSRRLYADAGCVWAVADTAKQANAIEAFHLEPTLLLRYGSTVRHVAIWAVNKPLSPEDGERVNKHLAHKFRAPKKYAGQFAVPPPGAVAREGRAKVVSAVGGSGESYPIGRVCFTLPRQIPDADAWRKTHTA